MPAEIFHSHNVSLLELLPFAVFFLISRGRNLTAPGIENGTDGQAGFRILIGRHCQAIDADNRISRLKARPFAALTPTLNPLKLPGPCAMIIPVSDFTSVR